MTKAVVDALASVIQPDNATDTRRLALVVIRVVSRNHPELNRPHLGVLVPPIFASVRDTVTPVKVAAEAAFLAVFSVDEHDHMVFDRYMAGAGAELPGTVKRNMQDYFKRISSRLGSKDPSGVSTDEVEDELEVWSVGKVDLGYFGAE